MTYTPRITALQKRHTQLDILIAKEEARPSADIPKIQMLKREKLTIKDEIARLLDEEAEAA